MVFRLRLPSVHVDPSFGESKQASITYESRLASRDDGPETGQPGLHLLICLLQGGVANTKGLLGFAPFPYRREVVQFAVLQHLHRISSPDWPSHQILEVKHLLTYPS